MKLTFKNIIASLLFQIVTIICGFIVPRLIISNYGSDVNGLVTSITQFLAYITLLEAGFGAVIKAVLYKPIVKNDKETIKKILKASEKIFRKISYIFIAYIIILCFVFPLIVSKDFDSVYTISLILIISISTFSEYYFGMTYKLFLHADQKPYVTYYIQIFTLILNTILVVILVKLGASIQIVKLVSASIFIFRPILHNIYVKKKYNISLKGVDDTYVIKQKWNALFNHIAYIIRSNTDVAVLTIFSSIKEVSVYAVYMLVINSIKSVTYSFTGGIDASFGKTIAKGEHEKVNDRFKKFVTYYYTVSSVLFIATFFLIVPFISLYTKGISDVNYIRPTFAYIMLAATFMLSIKDPYNDLVKVVGHFKQTQKGAFLEAILNIVISIALVFNYGLVGVAIGTLVSTTIRTIELMFYATKNILKTSIFHFVKSILLIIIEFALIYLIIYLIGDFNISNYIDWIIYAIIVTSITILVIIPTNLIFNKNICKIRRK